MKKTCKITGREFDLTQDEIEFYQKMKVPTSDIHPEEAFIRRVLFRNERNLYKTTDAHSGETILSVFDEDSPVKKVYEQDFYRSDDWDPKSYARDYDFSRSFFEQFKELLYDVPTSNLTNWNSVNNEYCNFTTDNKGCYMVIGGDYNENCMFSKFNFHCKDSMDLYWSNYMELSYECIDCSKCFRTYFSQNAHDCADSWLLYNCSNCQDCFGCVNLRNKNYCIFNEQYTKEQYHEKMAELNPWNRDNLEALQEKFEKFRLDFPVKYADLIQCESCTGDHLSKARNCTNCFDVHDELDNLRNVAIGGFHISDIMNSDHAGHHCELIVNSYALPNDNNIIASMVLSACSYIQHSAYLSRSSNCFGCVGLRDAEYCILNKQYTKEEYEEMVQKIIKHMTDMPYEEKITNQTTGESKIVEYVYGDFFPASFSPFAYNESTAQDYFPKTKEEVLSAGFRWKERNRNTYTVNMSHDEIPRSIDEVDDSILSSIVECADKDKDYSPSAFRIIASELEFYKRSKLPLPKYSPQARWMRRQAKRNPYKLWKRTTEDGVEVMTPYSPDRPEKILSEEGYQKEVL